jgi:hypothetical protein
MTTLDSKKVIKRVCAQLIKCDSITEKACMAAEQSWWLLPDMEEKEANKIVDEIRKIHNKLGDAREMLGHLVWRLEQS